MSPTGIKGWMLPAFALVAGAMSQPVAAGISPQEFDDIGVSVVADAAVPLDAWVIDDSGNRRAMAELITRPTVLMFADYTCTTLCGPIVAFVAHALEQSRLRAGDEFGMVVIGLDPKDDASDAARMWREQLAGDAPLFAASAFVTAEQSTVRRITAALGYRYAYDQEHDQFAHPGAAYVLRSDGRLARILTGLGLSGDDMRLALVEAGQGRVGTIGDKVRLICSGFDPTHGTYDLMVSRLILATGLGTLLMLGGLIGTLTLLGRRRRAA
jgi:protein SCO1/2